MIICAIGICPPLTFCPWPCIRRESSLKQHKRQRAIDGRGRFGEPFFGWGVAAQGPDSIWNISAGLKIAWQFLFDFFPNSLILLHFNICKLLIFDNFLSAGILSYSCHYSGLVRLNLKLYNWIGPLNLKHIALFHRGEWIDGERWHKNSSEQW